MEFKKQIRQFMHFFLRGFRGIISLLYPECCHVCDKKLVEGENYICLDCLLKMPKTNYHLQPENGSADRFKGKIPYKKVASFLYYNKGGFSQKIMKPIKYKGNSGLGRYIGQLMAQNIQQTSHFFEDIDLLIPIPLHHKRQKLRGFNQAEEIAKGIEKITAIPVCSDLVTRKKQTQTQTKKGRYARWLNTMDIFSTEKTSNFNYNHVLIIDDVLTTGATIEACAQSVLQSYPEIKISILTVAVAE